MLVLFGIRWFWCIKLCVECIGIMFKKGKSIVVRIK